ncbi:low molecular weight protein-tyrosine-phosphatase [Pontimicrobium aquaticum]|uniref:protein-tyrosine-phosphatase n=1 Tax=Pontimicrobium aquaticum TaxID=2565367 RepID=A0A4U0EVZ7_9FLAO|nr:low molecular weight protein-tyrosine-phosphatase [Pontimicrobium aquaticum]TJY36101.1 low molecular weight phosphotyrosine protein phosphatase [Pontimicrobium aquaticum]
MTKILMVCLGNICRSPLAEGILKHKLPKNRFVIESAGTSNYHIGELPDKRSIDIAKKYGIDITDQRGRQFTVSDFDKYDYIYVMDTSNYQNVMRLARNLDDEKKVKLILDELASDIINVPDPYYGGVSGFDDVFQLLNKACDRIYDRLIE